MSLLFTLLHAHRRAPVPSAPCSLPPCNISITVHTHLSTDETSFSRSDPFPLALLLAFFLSFVLSKRIALVLSRTRPDLFSSGFYFGSLALLLLSSLNTFVYDIPCAPSFFSLSLRTITSPRFSIFSPSLFLFHSLFFTDSASF